FLEMRLSEKNYFISRNAYMLSEIKEKIASSDQLLDSAGNDIIRAVGEDNFELLKTHLKNYSDIVREVHVKSHSDVNLDGRLRTEGKKLREFSNTITGLERQRVNDIISRSKSVLFYS